MKHDSKMSLRSRRRKEAVFVNIECILNCNLSLQYRWLCKYWLYNCIMQKVSIFISLIHSRWLLDDLDYVKKWHMIFVSELEVSSYFFVSNAENEEDTEEISNRYANRDRNLTELTTIQFIDLQKEISNAELAKKFVREYQKMTDKLHKKWKRKKLIKQTMSFNFSDLIRSRSNLIYKERKRAFIEREVADVKEVQKARVKRKISIEKNKIAKHQQVIQSREDENLDDVIITSSLRASFSRASFFFDSIVLSSSSFFISLISSSKSLSEMQTLFELSQQLTKNQIASKSFVTTTRSKKGMMRPKSKVQKRLNSQRRYKAEVKTNNKTKKELTAAKKTAKMMKIRQKDVS